MKRLFATALLLVCGLTARADGRSATIVYIDGAKYYIHTVQPGQTLYALSRTYEVGEQAIRESNPSVATGGLRAGESIKIPYLSAVAGEPSEKRLRRAFDLHFVSAGETLYSISRLYGIPISTIIADNPALDPIHLRLGERILIRRQEIGTEDEAGSLRQWEEYRSSLNRVAAPGAVYHLVEPGETLYSLSRRFGTTEEELMRLNAGLRAANLKAGAIIRVPGVVVPSEEGGQLVAAPIDSMIRPDATHAGGDPFADRVIEAIDFRALRRSERLDVALLLPLAQEGLAANTNYLEFYQGFLLGLDSVRMRCGCSVDVTLFNTGRDSAKIAQIVGSEPFRRARLIVGPVYEEELAPVILHAEQEHIPVVSPLAHIDGINSDVLFQLAPDAACKYEKASNMFGAEKRITLIYGETTDSLFEREVLPLIGEREFRRHDYRYEHPNEIAKRKEQEGATSAADLTPLLDNDDDNLFIILADNEIDVERILAALASADSSLSARGHVRPRFAVLGNARWNRYANIDRTMFFKDRVTFISTYHAKRDSAVVTDFDSAYIRAFGTLPTLYSYRGYDTAQIFVPAMYNDIEYDLESRRYTPLQTSYRFGSSEGRRNHVNGEWTRVNYHPDFTITIE